MQNCQISLRVVDKLPKEEGLTPSSLPLRHQFPMSVGGRNYSVSCSDPKERAIRAYVITNDYAEFQQMSKKERKIVEGTARKVIQEHL